MYVGHVGVALGAKRSVPGVALLWLIVAAYLPDWTDAALCISGKYRDTGMLSHSLPAGALLMLLAAAVALLATGDRFAAAVVAAVVVSHLPLDYVSGLKPTWPGGPAIGLQIYTRPVVDFATEAIVIAAGWVLYTRSLPAGLRRWNESHVMLAALLGMQLAADVARLLYPSINKC